MRIQSFLSTIVRAISASLLLAASGAWAQINIRHDFSGIPDGALPGGSLVYNGTSLFGMTSSGGTFDAGTIFAWDTVNGFQTLHHFQDAPSNGSAPFGSLTLSGSTLYGMTSGGGSSGDGTIFRINTDGSGFSLLHHFTNDEFPFGSLTLSGTTLYGMTSGGGTYGDGTIFRINTDGSGFAILHEFANDEAPTGALVVSGTTLYGMTAGGGTYGNGTIFQIHTDGTGFGLLHEFAGGSEDGSNPEGSLTLGGSTLFGMTLGGGDSDRGIVFRLNLDGSGFQLLHEFAGGTGDGEAPHGSLALAGSSLFGMTSGGISNYGTVFHLTISGGQYETLHLFSGPPTDGNSPNGDLIVLGSELYGLTLGGGSFSKGTLFSLPVPELSSAVLACLGGSLLAVRRRRR